MSATVITFPVTRAPSDADYLRDRITALLTPWQVSEHRMRAALRDAQNIRRDVPGLTNDQIVYRVICRHKPTGPDAA